MKQKSEKAKEHVQSKYHQKCMELADNLKFTIEHPDTSIVSRIDAHKAANIKHNHSLLKSMPVLYFFVADSALLYEEIEKTTMHLVIMETSSPY